MPTPPPPHILAAFGAGSAEAEQLPGGQGQVYRCADIVFKPVANTAEASWLAATFEQLRVPGLRVARPVRSSDGRWVVGGWSAQRFVSGRAERRYDEIVEASFLLSQAMARVPKPKYLDDRDDIYTWADRLAWGEDVGHPWDLGDGHGARTFQELAVQRKPIDLAEQIVHGDMFGNVLFAGSAPPAVVDFTPYWHPAAWSAAVIVVDAISWGGADTGFIERWADLTEWPQMLLRALLFRLAVTLADLRSTPSSLVEMLSAVDVIRPYLD